MSLENHLVGHLQSMYVIERDYQIYLCDLSGKIHDQQLKSAISAQVTGINAELDNLKQCLNIFGAPLNDDMISPLIQAFRQTDQACMMHMTQGMQTDSDVHIAMTDISFGSWEIGMYQSLLTMARVLNRQDAVKLLEDTLKDEEEDLQKIQGILSDLINISKQQKAA